MAAQPAAPSRYPPDLSMDRDRPARFQLGALSGHGSCHAKMPARAGEPEGFSADPAAPDSPGGIAERLGEEGPGGLDETLRASIPAIADIAAFLGSAAALDPDPFAADQARVGQVRLA